MLIKGLLLVIYSLLFTLSLFATFEDYYKTIEKQEIQSMESFYSNQPSPFTPSYESSPPPSGYQSYPPNANIRLPDLPPLYNSR